MTIHVALEIVNAGGCYKCGTPIMMEKTLSRRYHERGETFYCPNGHGQMYLTTISAKLEAAEAEVRRLKGEVSIRDMQITNRDKDLALLKKRVT